MNPIRKATLELERVLDDLAQLDLTGSSRSELSSFATSLRLAQRHVQGLIVRIGLTVRRPEHHRAARAAVGAEPAAIEDILASPNGRERSSTVRQDVRRADAIVALPGFQSMLTDGRLGQDQLDTLSRAADRLTPEQLPGLDSTQLHRVAANLPADTFDRRVREAVERLLVDGDIYGDRMGREDPPDSRGDPGPTS